MRIVYRAKKHLPTVFAISCGWSNGGYRVANASYVSRMPENALTQLPISAIFIGANFALAALSFIKQLFDPLDDLIIRILSTVMVSIPILTILGSNWFFQANWIAFISVTLLLSAYFVLFILGFYSIIRVKPFRKIMEWMSFRIPPESVG